MQDDTFDGYFIPGIFIFGQKHGQLKVSEQSLIMTDDAGNELFSVLKQTITSIKDGLSQITIVTSAKKYKVIFRNAVKGFEKQAVLGPVFGTGGKNGVFSAGPQLYGKQVVESLINHGYPAKLNTHRSQ
jgi:hypothetical protein